ncbi:GNAT family N-acetyltransferase [Massilia sp. CFBP9012]|uniref:GNAT family N-acetyltransferase n=1 Tax=Massilia sp. CFBP9012 TaxID=3096531 RepID=UPI002A6A6407|nr:GNAT family N-acetyltransferase [Massilia sp. CFBP9012]MDY0975586.1 GNAT family N-acetyltransferase [Massilia sp. CFBP9012]
MRERRFGHLGARAPTSADEAFLDALYLDSRPDLGALPVPRGVIEGIARHQRAMQVEDYARRYAALETWLVTDRETPIARVVLAEADGAVRVVDLSVALAARRKGIASSVLHALQEESDRIALRVRTENLAARRLYEGLGFTLLQADDATMELEWRQKREHPE